MAEEIEEKKVFAEVKAPQPVAKKEPWKPKLTLLVKHDSPNTRIHVGRETTNVADGKGGFKDVSRAIDNKEVWSVDLKSFPALYARKYALWGYFDVSEQDKARLMGMSVQAVAMAERTGNWPQD